MLVLYLVTAKVIIVDSEQHGFELPGYIYMQIVFSKCSIVDFFFPDAFLDIFSLSLITCESMVCNGHNIQTVCQLTVHVLHKASGPWQTIKFWGHQVILAYLTAWGSAAQPPASFQGPL